MDYKAQEFYLPQPPKAEYRIIIDSPVCAASAADHGDTSYPHPEPHDMEGFVTFSSGTSNASGTTQFITYTPRNGAIPWYEMELMQAASFMSLDAEIREV